MNTTEANTNSLRFAGNSITESELCLERLRETYEEAGLTPHNALEAARADYAQLFINAA